MRKTSDSEFLFLTQNCHFCIEVKSEVDEGVSGNFGPEWAVTFT